MVTHAVTPPPWGLGATAWIARCRARRRDVRGGATWLAWLGCSVLRLPDRPPRSSRRAGGPSADGQRPHRPALLAASGRPGAQRLQARGDRRALAPHERARHRPRRAGAVARCAWPQRVCPARSARAVEHVIVAPAAPSRARAPGADGCRRPRPLHRLVARAEASSRARCAARPRRARTPAAVGSGAREPLGEEFVPDPARHARYVAALERQAALDLKV